MNDFDTVKDLTADEFLTFIKRMNGDKRIWFACLKRWADTKDTDAFMKDWNALGLAGNRYAQALAWELDRDRRDNSGKQVTEEMLKHLGLKS